MSLQNNMKNGELTHANMETAYFDFMHASMLCGITSCSERDSFSTSTLKFSHYIFFLLLFFLFNFSMTRRYTMATVVLLSALKNLLDTFVIRELTTLLPPPTNLPPSFADFALAPSISASLSLESTLISVYILHSV